jgi:hypothetical protein
MESERWILEERGREGVVFYLWLIILQIVGVTSRVFQVYMSIDCISYAWYSEEEKICESKTIACVYRQKGREKKAELTRLMNMYSRNLRNRIIEIDMWKV